MPGRNLIETDIIRTFDQLPGDKPKAGLWRQRAEAIVQKLKKTNNGDSKEFVGYFTQLTKKSDSEDAIRQQSALYNSAKRLLGHRLYSTVRFVNADPGNNNGYWVFFSLKPF